MVQELHKEINKCLVVHRCVVLLLVMLKCSGTDTCYPGRLKFSPELIQITINDNPNNY